jgi:hypothetical protein
MPEPTETPGPANQSSIGRNCLEYEAEWHRWKGGPIPSLNGYLARVSEADRSNLESRLRKVETYYRNVNKLTGLPAEPEPAPTHPVPRGSVREYESRGKAMGFSPFPAQVQEQVKHERPIEPDSLRGRPAQLWKPAALVLAALIAEYAISVHTQWYYAPATSESRNPASSWNLDWPFSLIYAITMVGGGAVLAHRVARRQRGLRKDPRLHVPVTTLSPLIMTPQSGRKRIGDGGLDMGLESDLDGPLPGSGKGEGHQDKGVAAFQEFRRCATRFPMTVGVVFLVLLAESMLIMLCELSSWHSINKDNIARTDTNYDDPSGLGPRAFLEVRTALPGRYDEGTMSAVDFRSLADSFQTLQGLLFVLLLITVFGGGVFLICRVAELGGRLAGVPELPPLQSPAWFPPRVIRQYLAAAIYVSLGWPIAYFLFIPVLLLGAELSMIRAWWFLGCYLLSAAVLIVGLFPVLLRSAGFETILQRRWLVGLLVAVGLTLSLLVIVPMATLDIPEATHTGTPASQAAKLSTK